MDKPLIDILIPSFNNYQYLVPCVKSILGVTGLIGNLARIIIINNGEDPYENIFKDDHRIKVLTPGKNLGWESGLKLGLENSNAEFVCFLNDDTFLPQSEGLFFHRLLAHFLDPKVGIVSPITTTAAGCQSIYSHNSPKVYADVNWAIFFCAMVRRKYLDELGGIDDSLPGGDDLDLCFRMRKSGYRVIIEPQAFIIHHGFVTGTRVRGGHNQIGGWNSPEMTEATNIALIKKHGFRFFLEHLRHQVVSNNIYWEEDSEGNLIRSLVNGDLNILELGCGAKKTVDRAIGLDKIPNNEPIDTLNKALSVANITCNVEERLPFENDSQDLIISRHILEHCLDTVSTLREWKRVLRPGGRLIVAVPDERITNGIPLNPEHVHAFSPSTLSNLSLLIGLEMKQVLNPNNGISFIAELVKNA